MIPRMVWWQRITRDESSGYAEVSSYRAVVICPGILQTS